MSEAREERLAMLTSVDLLLTSCLVLSCIVCAVPQWNASTVLYSMPTVVDMAHVTRASPTKSTKSTFENTPKAYYG